MTIIIKIAVSTAFVIILASISTRVNPILGGICAGLPLGVGISVFFIAYEQGTTFMVQGIPWGIAGLTGSMVFCLAYLIIGQISINNVYIHIFLCTTTGFSAFLFWSLVLHSLPFTIFTACLFFILCYIINIILVKSVIKKFLKIKSATSHNEYLLFRGVVSGLIITAITVASQYTGSKGAGIMSAFPSVLFALIVVLHKESGISNFPKVLQGFSSSIITLAVFYISSFTLLNLFSLNVSFILIYLISAVFLYISNQFQKYITHKV